MAQAQQAQSQPELEPEDPLEILRGGLMQEQVAATEEAAVKMSASATNMVVNDAQSQGPRVVSLDAASAYADIVVDRRTKANGVMVTNQSIEDLYDRTAGTKYVGTMPPGSRLTVTKNITTKTLSDGSVELFVKQTTPEVPPAKVFQAQQEAYSRPQGAVFNLENEEEKLKGLTGEERLNGITKLLSNIGAQMTQRRQNIGQQAAIQSGYTSAQVALDRALQLEQLPNPQFGGLSFAQRFGVPSAQTVQAQEFMRASQISMMQLEESMLKKDAEFSKYAYAERRLLGIEARTAERQARAEAKAEDKKEQLAESIPQHQTAAYQALHPNVSADEANAQLVKAAKNNKPEFIATQTTPDNIYDNLTHGDLAVRQATLSVMTAHDKANNSKYANADKTPTSELIKPFVANPSLLEKDAIKLGLVTKEDVATLTTQIAGAEPKRKASLRQEYQAMLLRKLIERSTYLSYTNDMRNWQATETGSGTALGMIIASVSKANPSGNADMPTVIEKFINDTSNTIPYEQRVDILKGALGGAVSNEFKTMLYPDMSGVQSKVMTELTNAAARARIKIRTPSIQSMQLNPGFGYQGFGSERQ